MCSGLVEHLAFIEPSVISLSSGWRTKHHVLVKVEHFEHQVAKDTT